MSANKTLLTKLESVSLPVRQAVLCCALFVSIHNAVELLKVEGGVCEERVEHYYLSCRTTVDLRLPAATQMTASLVDRVHIACFGEEMHQLAVGL